MSLSLTFGFSALVDKRGIGVHASESRQWPSLDFGSVVEKRDLLSVRLVGCHSLCYVRLPVYLAAS